MIRFISPLSVVLAAPCLAASITWSTGPTTVVDENSIDLTGTFVHAANYGSNARSVPVGGETVVFASGTHSSSSNPILTGDSIVSANGQTNQGGGFNPPGAIDGNFHAVMDGFAYDGPNPKVLKLGNLTPGSNYQVQLFVSDDRGCCSGRTQKWSDSATGGVGNETPVFSHAQSTFVIGEFTASGTEQAIYGHGVGQSQNVLTAYILRETTPTPPTAPTDLLLSNTDLVSALPAGSPVGVLSTEDPNAADTHTYTLVDPGSFPDNALFAIVNGNELETAAVTGGIGTTYQVKLRTTDNTARSFDKVFTLSVVAVPPVINSLTALPGTIAPAGSATIQWDVSNATSLTLNGNPVTGTSTVVSPLITTGYTLEASNADGSVSADVTVTVANVPDFLPAEARFVEVVKKDSVATRLHISEIEVFPFGVEPDEADPDGTSQNDLVQAGSPSTETPPTTTALSHGSPLSVFDGDLESGAAVWTSANGLGFEPRYMLDLGSTFAVDKVRVWGRADTCCTDRLQNFEVNLYADDGSGNPGALANSILFPGVAPNATVGPAEFQMAIPDPGVRSFSVDKPLIAPGEPIVLSWEVNDTATSVVIDNGVGDVTALTDPQGFGSTTVTPGPNADTTYSILVTKPTGNSSASLTVLVTDQPLIYSFAADQTVVAPSTPVQLSWAAGNHTTLELNGVNVFGTTGTTVSPAVSTNYTLTATNPNGTLSEEIHVRIVIPGEPLITEFMAENSGDVTLDEDGASSDWIEIGNPSASDAFLDGYYLTDDPFNLTKWRLPNVVLAPGGYLLVFASGKDRVEPLSELHSNFLLNDTGEYLALVKPDGSTIVVEFTPEYPSQKPEVSFGFNDLGDQEGFFLSPTPGAANGTVFAGFVGDTMFNPDRGFYSAPINVAITTTEPGAQIRYTLDGTEPTEATGQVYVGPVPISSTTVLRAAGFKPGFVPTNVDTQTYVYTADVVTQSTMLTSITQDPVYGPQMDASLKAIPTLSLVFQGGIERTEKEASVEFIGFEAGSRQFDVGMSRFGNYVTNFAKRSMRLSFKSEYGESKLRFPVFDGHEYEIDPANEIDDLDLRSGNHDMVARGAYMSNRFTDDTMIAMGNIAPHGRFVHIYINGVYWGQYHMRERWDAAMLAEYFPGAREDFETVNANNTGSNFLEGDVTYGSGQYWEETKTLINGPTPFTNATSHIDLPNVIDFMLLWVSGNSESEFRSGGSVPLGVPFKFFMKDADGFLRNPGHPVTHQGPLSVMARMAAEGDPDYRILLADRIHKHFFNDGAFTPARNIARLQERVDEISLSFISEAARWNYRSPASWQSYQNDLINNKFPALTNNMVNSFRSAGMYPTIVAPSFAQHGGTVPAGFGLTMSAPAGTIYYTTDGSDPRLPGGAISPLAQTYSGALTLNQATQVKSRVWTGAAWSALNEAVFVIDSDGLVVSEFMYNPSPPTAAEIAAGHNDSEDFEYLELLNTGTGSIDLTGILLDTGISFDFATGSIPSLAPGERVLIVEDAAAFAFRYGPGHPVAGQYTGKLKDEGELVRVANALSTPLIEFSYLNAAPWPVEAAGGGSSVVLIDPLSDPEPNDPLNWQASGVAGGTPGGEEVMSFTFAEWAALNGVTNPNDDEDQDLLTNFTEFVRGTPPLSTDALWSSEVEMQFLEVEGILDAYLTLSYTVSLAAEDVTTTVEHSNGLHSWNSGPGFTEHLHTLYHGDGSATVTWRSATPMMLDERQFMRAGFSAP